MLRSHRPAPVPGGLATPGRREVAVAISRRAAVILDLLADAHDGDLDLAVERLLRRGLAIDVEDAACST